HDLVRIVTQNGAQAAGKRQAFLLVDRNLVDAANLVLDRIFNRDDLIFFGLDLVDGSIERRRLAGTSRSGDQHHAVRLIDVTAKASQVVLAEANYVERERAELLAHRFFVEHAQHGIFAVNRRHDRNAEINGPRRIAVVHAEAAILRHAALGDIEFAHYLNAR